MKKLFGLMVLVLVLCVMCAASADDCVHDFGDMQDCTYSRYCLKCETYIDGSPEHAWNRYATRYVEGEHIVLCANAQCAAVQGVGACFGGTATCTEQALCEGCGDPYGELLSRHDWGDWRNLTSQYHERRCAACPAQQLEDHIGGKATCSSPRICDVCNEGYGSPDNSGVAGHPNPVVELVLGNCLDLGYYRITCDEPNCSAPFTEFIYPARGQHTYNDWQPLGDGAHVSICAACGEELTVPCAIFTQETFAACPICGEYDGGVLPVLIAREDDALPYGTLLVRGGEIPADGVLWAFTVAGSYGGQVVELQAPVTIRIPMALEGFRVLGMDGAEIAFTLTDGLLTIETGAAGLFLLVPAE